jgi:hypothetical protein
MAKVHLYKYKKIMFTIAFYEGLGTSDFQYLEKYEGYFPDE